MSGGTISSISCHCCGYENVVLSCGFCLQCGNDLEPAAASPSDATAFDSVSEHHADFAETAIEEMPSADHAPTTVLAEPNPTAELPSVEEPPAVIEMSECPVTVPDGADENTAEAPQVDSTSDDPFPAVERTVAIPETSAVDTESSAAELAPVAEAVNENDASVARIDEEVRPADRVDDVIAQIETIDDDIVSVDSIETTGEQSLGEGLNVGPSDLPSPLPSVAKTEQLVESRSENKADGGSSMTPDQLETVFSSAAENMGVVWVETPQGWAADIPCDNGRGQRVFVSRVRTSDGSLMLSFFAICGPASQENALPLLEWNSQMPFCAFAVRSINGQKMFIITANSLALALDDETVAKTLKEVATRADQVEQRIAGGRDQF